MRFGTLILRNIARRRTRSALTVLGLAVGIAAVVGLLGIAWGFERSFMDIYTSKGIDLVVVRSGVADRLTSHLDASMGARLREVAGVRDVAAALMDAVSFEEANLVSVLVNGWEPGSLLFRGVRLIEGRELLAADKSRALLGRTLAANLGKQVGDEVDVAGKRFEVVGVFEADSLYENGSLIMPLAQLQTMMGREGQVTSFMVKARDAGEASVRSLGKQIAAGFPGVGATPARDFVQGEVLIGLAKSMAWATSVLALVLGSVGMLNTMVMAVFERTREIGVLRSLGWRRGRVLRLILGEALALGVLGTILGGVMGVVGVRLIALSPRARAFISADVPPAALGVGLGLGLLLSVVGGLYPAVRASRLEPTEALRHD